MDDYNQRLLRLGEPTLDASPFSQENIEAKVLCAFSSRLHASLSVSSKAD